MSNLSRPSPRSQNSFFRHEHVLILHWALNLVPFLAEEKDTTQLWGQEIKLSVCVCWDGGGE